jgi:hypothetical protein
MHWVTITEIDTDKSGEYILTVSSWEKAYTLNLNDIWSYTGFLDYAGFAYFE